MCLETWIIKLFQTKQELIHQKCFWKDLLRFRSSQHQISFFPFLYKVVKNSHTAAFVFSFYWIIHCHDEWLYRLLKLHEQMYKPMIPAVTYDWDKCYFVGKGILRFPLKELPALRGRLFQEHLKNRKRDSETICSVVLFVPSPSWAKLSKGFRL